MLRSMAEPPDDVGDLVELIHAAPAVAVVAVTGAGSAALAWLLAVPGASRTLLEGTVPYARSALRALLGADPADHVSRETAIAMARAARARAEMLGAEDHAGVPVIGLACTATIATDRAKRGAHRCWVAAATAGGVDTYGLVLEKGARARADEEALVSRLVLHALALACGVPAAPALRLRPGERIEEGLEPR